METIFNVIASNLANKMPFKSLFKELGDGKYKIQNKKLKLSNVFSLLFLL